MTASGRIDYAVEEHIAVVTISRPDRLNAFAGRMREELAGALRRASAQDDVRVIVITGEGRAFSAGADLDVMRDLLARRDVAGFEVLVRAGADVVRAIAQSSVPVIAAVNGVAAGAGASLAAACDVRLVSDTARIGFTFNRIGLHPDWGATFTLPRLVGAGHAADLILSARMMDAAEATALGFSQQTARPAEFEGVWHDFATMVAEKPPLAISAARRNLAPDLERLECALAAETEAQLRCFQSDDVREGIAAFLEKRPARFSGH